MGSIAEKPTAPAETHAEKKGRPVGRRLLLAFPPAVALGEVAQAAGNRATPPKERRTMKIRLSVGGRTLTADLTDSGTTRDFVSLLPLTLTMNDLFGREKFGHLPRAISEGGERTRTYEVGDVIYWSPGPDLAIMYRQDGPPIPTPGIIVIGKITSGVEAFDVPGSVVVTVEPTP